MYNRVGSFQDEQGNFYLIEGDLITVWVADDVWDIGAKASAKRSSEDAFNLDFGMKLAYYRAMQRLSRKMQRKMIRSQY